MVKIEMKNATKEGLYVNGYVVHLSREKIKKLDGKTVRIKGKVTYVIPFVPGRDGKQQQGILEDSWHILKPKIKIIDEG